MAKKIRYRPGKVQARMGFAVGIIFIILGVTMVIPMTFGSGMAPIGLFGLAWTGIAVYNTVVNGKILFGKVDEDMYGSYEITDTTVEGTTPPSAGSTTGDHDHIPSTALNARGRLEQLEQLRSAGLLTEDEYREKRKEILREL